MNRRSFCLGTAGVFVLGSQAEADASTPRIALNAYSDGTAPQATLDRFLIALTSHLLRTGKYQVVDRARLDSVIREQGFSNSAYADPKTAAALGRLAGASRILNATVGLEASDSGGAYLVTHAVMITASFTLVGVDSGQILAAGSAQGVGQRQTPNGASSPASPSQLEREANDSCCEDLMQQISNG